MNMQYQRVLQLLYNPSLLKLSTKFWKTKIQVKSLLKGVWNHTMTMMTIFAEHSNHRGDAYFEKRACF